MARPARLLQAYARTHARNPEPLVPLSVLKMDILTIVIAMPRRPSSSHWSEHSTPPPHSCKAWDVLSYPLPLDSGHMSWSYTARESVMAADPPMGVTDPAMGMVDPAAKLPEEPH